MALIIAVLVYETYQAIWGTCCFEPFLFFGGFIFYWIMLIRGIHWHDKEPLKHQQRNEMSSSQVRKRLTSTKQYMRVLT